MQDANLVKSVMQFMDCFLEDFKNEDYKSKLSDLDTRAQVEVNLIPPMNFKRPNLK